MSLLDDLVSYWKSDESSGNLIDEHASYDCADNNTVGTDAGGIINSARSYVPTSAEFFSLADTADFKAGGGGDFTFSAWIKRTSPSNNRSVLTKWGAANSREYNLEAQVNADPYAIYWSVSSAGTSGTVTSVNSATNKSDGTWYHCVCYHDAGTGIGLIINDGTPITAAHTGGVVATKSADFRVGSDALNNSHWHGLLDEIGFWHRLLTAQEITDLYNSGAGLAYSEFGGGGAPASASMLSLLGVG
jgi:hypothetical protein